MNPLLICPVFVLVVVGATCLPTDALAQWTPGYHRHHGVRSCGVDVVVSEWFSGVQLRQPFWLAPVPVVPQPIEVFPLFSFSPPQAPVAVLDADENFARQEVWLPERRREVDGLPGQGFDDATEIRRRAAVLKASSPAGRMRADRFISKGDQAFAEQKLARATAQYRQAIAQAPDYAAPHFRLAHAYVATRQYNLALKSALLALELSHSSRRAGFSLEDMYQGDRFPREQHLRSLVDASLREPSDGGLRFLIGFTLHYDGEPIAGEDHFRAARDLEGIHVAYVSYFCRLNLWKSLKRRRIDAFAPSVGLEIQSPSDDNTVAGEPK